MTTRTALLALSLTVALVLPFDAAAQQPPAPPKPAETTTPPPPSRAPQLANIRLEFRISEEGEGASTTPRVVTMLVADHANGRVRSGVGASLNIDARPEIVRDGRVRVTLTLEYNVGSERALGLIEQLSVLLEDGKLLQISQSADPRTDRKVRLELTATILK